MLLRRSRLARPSSPSRTRAKIYLGQTMKIAGATIAPSITKQHAWTVVGAPTDSAITTASLENATTASPMLKPDRLGTIT